MNEERHQQFLAQFSPSKYHKLVDNMSTATSVPPGWRVCETPLFLDERLTNLLIRACDELLSQIASPEFARHAHQAIPRGKKVANEEDHSAFILLDFALVQDEVGQLVPRLIELDGFASVFAYCILQEQLLCKYADISDEWTGYFSGFDEQTYLDLLRRVIVQDHDPENVVLLDIEPETQKTRIDYACTDQMLGTKTICPTQVIKQGKQLYYEKEGQLIAIKRIYNRITGDVLHPQKQPWGFDFTDDIEVSWVAHPDWWWKISKHSLPFFQSEFSPDCRFLNDERPLPLDLENYVLKPLFDYGGRGVVLNVTPDRIAEIPNTQDYVLQRKVEYASCVPTLNGYSKAEIRMIILWDKKPQIAHNVVRVMRGDMANVGFNTTESWVGCTGLFHRRF